MATGTVPPYNDFFAPIIEALRALGESAGLTELTEATASVMQISDDALALPHVRRKGTAAEEITSSSEFGYRLRWALTYLKKAGFVVNSTRGVWSLTEQGRGANAIDARAVIDVARSRFVSATETVDGASGPELSLESVPVADASWSDQLIDILLDLEPSAFERLTQRLLREAGFAEVQVTGRTGDGGIDGRGILRLNDLVSMSAVFQCKRYSGNVGAEAIRQFRGALIGRADRGIFVTTSGFTPAASQEASRDGVTPIDLIDGERLVVLLKRFELGVSVKTVEVVQIDRHWFDAL